MKYLIVGAGFSGATIARELADAGHEITVIDKRNHIAGNAYDYINEYGIRIHSYGPHLFHTNNKKVFLFLSRFTEWTKYEHKVKALLNDGSFVPFPPNLETKQKVDNIIEKLYRPYTKKMWGKELEEINPSIINRVPGRNDYEDRYFPNDQFQFMPSDGYTSLVGNILNHSNISVYINTEFDKSMEDKYDHIFNSMPIDEYYDYIHGELEYRSIKFHNYGLPIPTILPCTTVNYTHSGPFTRITEWKNIPGHGTNESFTSITVEEPCDYKDNNMERYYPINDFINKERYNQYKLIKNDKVTFIGRCGQYVYIDMDQAINSALRIAMDWK